MRRFVEIDPRIKCGVKDLIDEPILITVNDFTEETAKKFRDQFDRAHEIKQPVIPVLIDSYGGEVYSLLSMIDTIDNSSIPVATVAMGKAMSCGAILFSCGSKGMRYVAPNAHIMIHDVSLGARGKEREVLSTANQGRLLNDEGYRRMARNCGQPEDYFLDLVHDHHGHADWYLDAKAAKRHKLASKIGLPTLRTSVKVELHFG